MLHLITKESKALPRITVTITLPTDDWHVTTLLEEHVSVATLAEAHRFLEHMKSLLTSRFIDAAQTTQEFERLIAFQDVLP